METLHGESLQNQEPLGGHPKLEDFLVLAGQWCWMVFDFVEKQSTGILYKIEGFLGCQHP